MADMARRWAVVREGAKTPAESLSVVAEDIGHLHVGAGHWVGSADWRQGEQVERTGRGGDLAGGEVEIAGGGGEAAMTEQELDGTDVGAGFEQVNSETVSQRMGCEGLGQAQGFVAGAHHRMGGKVACG